MPRKLTVGFVFVILLIASCSSSGAGTPLPTAVPPSSVADTPLPEADPTMISAEPSVLAEVIENDVDSAAAHPVWLTVNLTDAATGETFTLADFAGKTVYVEPMATWCTNCRAQQQQVREVKAALNPGSFVFVSLSVEPNDTTEGLAEYRQREDFPWVFAVAPPDMIASLVEQFGRTVTSPPSTPHFVISPDGMISQLATGQHSAAQLTAELNAAAGA